MKKNKIFMKGFCMENKEAVLMSIQPEWVKHIFIDKDKIYEVRRRAPLLQSPYKIYVYCTKKEPVLHRRTMFWEGDMNGFVCGEFTCVCTIERTPPWKDKSKGTCLTDRQLAEYSCLDHLLFLEIDNPILYDKPLKLEEFGIHHVPQSWQYCEEITAWIKKT